MPAFNSSLFKNERKERDNQPDFTGPGQITKEDFLAIYDQVMANQYNTCLLYTSPSPRDS